MTERAPRLLALLYLVSAPLTTVAHAQSAPRAEAEPTSPHSCRAAGTLVHRIASSPELPPASSDPDLAAAITSRAAADRTLADLTRLAAQPGGCAAAIAARGLVKWEMQDRGWIPLEGTGQRAGVPWEEAAVRDMVSAARHPGGTAPDAALIAGRMLLSRGQPSAALLLELGDDLLQELPARQPDAGSAAQLVRGRLALALSKLPVADSALRAYRDAGGRSDAALLDLARVELGAGDAGADTLYYAAAASAEPAVLDGLVHDLSFIADSAELRQLGETPAADRPRWLRTFWESRDLESLRPRGSRLAEHYRRLAFARAHYRLRTFPRRYETYELWRNGAVEFDDRGMIYLRHGPPDDSAAAVRYGACPNVTWVYRRPEGNLVFNFAARDDPDDWRLVETLPNVSGQNGATNRRRTQSDDNQCAPIDDLFASRADIDPVYARLAVRASRYDLEEELALTRRSREVGTTTDSDELRFRTPLASRLQSYALFGPTAATARALLVLTTRADALASAADSAVRMELHIVAMGAAVPVEMDTTRSFRAAGAPGTWVTIAQELPLPREVTRLGMVVRTGEQSGQVFREPVRLPSATGLAMSDVIAAEESGGHRWQARDGVLSLNPLGSYAIGQPIVLYYEVAGSGGGSLRTSIELRQRKQVTSVAFTEPGSDGVRAFRRTLGTDRLREGPLAITITVRTDGGSSTSRQLTVAMVKAGAGER
jgi:GWxTD domain-containing protein